MRWKMLSVGMLLWGCVLATPAWAGGVWEWRTDDGGYAFSDDEDAIPARYRDRARLRQVGGLASYDRHTGIDPAAATRYEERLAARLERLRSFNAMVAASRAGAAPGAAATTPAGDRMILRTGQPGAPGIDIGTSMGSSGPVVVENTKILPSGGAITQPAQIVRRDGEVISITKSRPREWNLFDDVHDEDDLH